MAISVKDLMTKQVITCTPSTEIKEAVRVVGIITEPDLVKEM